VFVKEFLTCLVLLEATKWRSLLYLLNIRCSMNHCGGLLHASLWNLLPANYSL